MTTEQEKAGYDDPAGPKQEIKSPVSIPPTSASGRREKSGRLALEGGFWPARIRRYSVVLACLYQEDWIPSMESMIDCSR